MAISSRDLFDEEFYLNANPDVAEAVASGKIRSAFRHFDRFGQFEGRDPSLLFDTAYYVAENPDVAAAVASGEQDSAFKHFRKFGQFEGRTPIAQFDNNLYLAQNQDVAAAVSSGPFKSGYQHFVEYGQNENRPGAPNLVGVPFSTDSSKVSEAEAQLEALLQTALRTGEIGFRDGARRVVVVATDAPYHIAGDGAEAGITIPNNNNTVLDGNPPGTGEDYPSVAQVRNALQSANIVPVFAVTPGLEERYFQ